MNGKQTEKIIRVNSPVVVEVLYNAVILPFLLQGNRYAVNFTRDPAVSSESSLPDYLLVECCRQRKGTTVNTLLFAYLGESLLLFSYLKMQDYTLETLLNSKILFQNCVSMIFGAIACVVVMPVAAVLVGKRINIV